MRSSVRGNVAFPYKEEVGGSSPSAPTNLPAETPRQSEFGAVVGTLEGTRSDATELTFASSPVANSGRYPSNDMRACENCHTAPLHDAHLEASILPRQNMTAPMFSRRPMLGEVQPAPVERSRIDKTDPNDARSAAIVAWRAPGLSTVTVCDEHRVRAAPVGRSRSSDAAAMPTRRRRVRRGGDDERPSSSIPVG